MPYFELSPPKMYKIIEQIFVKYTVPDKTGRKGNVDYYIAK